MSVNEIFEEFLTYCNNYEIILDNLIIKNEENVFILYKQNDLNKNYLIYESRIGSARQTGYIDDLDDLIEVAISTVGNDMIKTKSRNSYF